MPADVRTLIHHAARRLLAERAADGLDEARLQAELLYAEAAGWDRAGVIAAGSEAPEAPALAGFERMLARRLAHEPFAYILGRREFYGLTFQVGPGVLIPRPESETLVEAALAAVREHPRTRRALRVADVGTGCGAVALAIAAHAPAAQVVASDASTEALAYAGRNRERLGLAGRVVLLAGDLLEPFGEPLDVVVANLPYVRTAEYEALPPELHEWEPRGAFDGGEDGLDVLRAFASALPEHLADGAAAVLVEAGEGQSTAVCELLTAAIGGDARVHRDLGGTDRVVEVRVGYREGGDG